MNEWLWAAVVLTALLIPLTGVAARRRPADGLVAMELAGTLAALVLMLIAEGTHRQGFIDLGLVLGVMSFIGVIAFVRFMRRED
jgi:multisubunit Na+/H+ antiporter MnhF subunit